MYKKKKDYTCYYERNGNLRNTITVISRRLIIVNL